MTANSTCDTIDPGPVEDRFLTGPARERLLQERKTRIEQLSAIESAAAQYGSDELSVARLAVVRFALEEIDAALARLDQGVYGVCQDCWKRIEPERLDILPRARFCVRCQAAHR